MSPQLWKEHRTLCAILRVCHYPSSDYLPLVHLLPATTNCDNNHAKDSDMKDGNDDDSVVHDDDMEQMDEI